MVSQFLMVVLATHCLTWTGLALATPVDEPGDELTVYVMTMGPGDAIWERFGHNVIWVSDRRAGTDIAYNWGVFRFDQENFYWNFLHGRMLYSMDVFDADEIRHVYLDAFPSMPDDLPPEDWLAMPYMADNRSVWVQELNLTAAQRAALREFLIWNARPENREYQYDYFRDNCSTRVRDALDGVLGGEIRARTGDRSAGTTYRWHTRRLVGDSPHWYALLHTLLSGWADRPISQWDEMFLPIELMAHLRSVRVTDEQGREVPLVRSEWTLFPSDRPPPAESPPNRLGLFALSGLLMGGGLAGLAWLGSAGGSPSARPKVSAENTTKRKKSKRKRKQKPPALGPPGGGLGQRLSRFFLAAVGGFWLLLIGLIGAVLAWGWLFTDHVAGHANENLFQFNPLALVAAVLFPLAIWRRRGVLRWALGLSAALAGLSILGLFLKILPGFSQVNTELIALALPAHLGLLGSIYLTYRSETMNVEPTPRPPGSDGSKADRKASSSTYQ